MSLLEDVFLQDEAGEAQELERIIEGDEFEQRPRSRSDSENDSEKEDEAVEDKRSVDPNSNKTRRVIKNPRFILNPARLIGPRGIQVIPDHFKDFKFKGKGHEKEDLDLVLKKLEHWAYRLYPKFKFEDCLKKIETLGKKRPVMVHLHKIRSDQYISEETVVQKDSSDEEVEKPPEDEFDKLLQQQIELARSTPAPASIKKNMNSTIKEHSFTIMPRATSSPSISVDQRERMIRNRKLAEERRAKLINATVNVDEEETNNVKAIGNRSNVDSSDEEVNFNTSVTADIHRLIGVNQHEIDNQQNKSNDDNGIDSMDTVSCNIVTDSSNFDVIEESNEKVNSNTNINSSGDVVLNNEITENNEKLVIVSELVQNNNIINEIEDNGNVNNEIEYDNSDNQVLNNDNERDVSHLISKENKIPYNDDKTDKVDDVVDSNDVENNDEINKESDEIDKEVDTKEPEEVQEENIDELMDVDFSEEF